MVEVTLTVTIDRLFLGISLIKNHYFMKCGGFQTNNSNFYICLEGFPAKVSLDCTVSPPIGRIQILSAISL